MNRIIRIYRMRLAEPIRATCLPDRYLEILFILQILSILLKNAFLYRVQKVRFVVYLHLDL